MEKSSLPIKGCKILAYARRSGPLSRERFYSAKCCSILNLQYLIYLDTFCSRYIVHVPQELETLSTRNTVSKVHKDTPAYPNLSKGFIGINYLFPEWIKKELDKILGTLHPMGSPYMYV
jgi:hypothetical protein